MRSRFCFLNLIPNSLYRFALQLTWCFTVLFVKLQRITFQFVAIVGAQGQVHVGSKMDEPGPTGKMIKHSTSTRLLKTPVV